MIHHRERDPQHLILGAVASGTGIPATRHRRRPGPDGPRAGDGTPVSTNPQQAYLQGLDDGARKHHRFEHEQRRTDLRERRTGGAVVLVLAALLAVLVLALGWPEWVGAVALGLGISSVWGVSSAALRLHWMDRNDEQA